MRISSKRDSERKKWRILGGRWQIVDTHHSPVFPQTRNKTLGIWLFGKAGKLVNHWMTLVND
jgi:hypothetical protein